MSKTQLPSVTRMKPRRRLRLGRLMFLLPAGAVVLYLGWGTLEQRKLARMVAQYRRVGEPVLPEDFDQPAVPDADNAAIDLRSAAMSIDTKDPLFDELWHRDLQPPLTESDLAFIRKLLAAFPNALPGVDSATGKTGVDWKLHARTPVILTATPDFGRYHDLAVLLAADLLAAHQAGDDARALRRAGQILFISRAIDRQPTLVAHLVANGIAALAADRIMEIAPTLNVANDQANATVATDGPADRLKVRALIDTLLAQDADNAGLAWAMRGERMEQLDSLTAIADGKFNAKQVQGTPTSGGPDDGKGAAQSVLSGCVLKPLMLGDARLMLRYMTKVIAAAPAQNRPAAQSRFPALPPEVKEHPTMHLFSSLFLPSLDRTFQEQFRFRTDMILAATSLAIRQYALDHNGNLPKQLIDLAPRCLLAVPLDPMTAGKPLGYIHGGENGTDEGGSEQPLRKSTSARDRWGTQDAVVHLTQQSRKPEADADDVTAQRPAPARF
jgi:hypothetical protein